MSDAITIRLEKKLARELDRVTRKLGLTRSEFVRNALEKQLLLAEFDRLRAESIPYAAAAGYFTDEDVFRDVS